MTMIVKINGVAETEVLNYITVWEMNAIGSCLIILDDTGGGSSAKYTPEDYMFEDIVIEYPSGTAIWKGRIRRIEYLDDSLALHGEDWLGQFKDQHIDFSDSWEDSGTFESVDYDLDRCVDNDKSWPASSFLDEQLIITSAGSGTRNNWIYAREFEITPQTFNGGYVERTWTNDWNGVLADRANYALCARISGAIITDLQIILIAKTVVNKADIISLGLGVDVAAHVRGGDYGNSSLSIYNWGTETWDNLGTGDCNHNYEQDYGWQSKNYVNDDGIVKVRLRAWNTSNEKYLIFDYLKLTVRYNTTMQGRAFIISEAGGTNMDLIDDIASPDILAGDSYKVVAYIWRHLFDGCLGHPVLIGSAIGDYQQALTTSYAASQKVSLSSWDYDLVLSILEKLAVEDGLDFWLDHVNLKFYYGKYITTTKTIELSQNYPILKRSVACEGDKLVNKAVIVGDGITETRTNTSSKETYQNTWKTLIFRDNAIDSVPVAREVGDSILHRRSQLKKHPLITMAGLADVNVGDMVALTLPNQDVNDSYIVRKKAFDYQQYESVLEFVPVVEQPHKKHDVIWDKLQDVDRRVHRLELK